jgi:hypothetical protein
MRMSSIQCCCAATLQLVDFDETQYVLANSAIAQEVTTAKDLSSAVRQVSVQLLTNTI